MPSKSSLEDKKEELFLLLNPDKLTYEDVLEKKVEPHGQR